MTAKSKMALAGSGAENFVFFLCVEEGSSSNIDENQQRNSFSQTVERIRNVC